jgi:hypothetical protein
VPPPLKRGGFRWGLAEIHKSIQIRRSFSGALVAFFEILWYNENVINLFYIELVFIGKMCGFSSIIFMLTRKISAGILCVLQGYLTMFSRKICRKDVRGTYEHKL